MINIKRYYPEKHFFEMSIQELKEFVKSQKYKWKRYEKRKRNRHTRRRKKYMKRRTRKNMV